MDFRPDLEKVRYYMHQIASHPFSGTEIGSVLDDAFDCSGKMIRATLLLASAQFGPDSDNKKDRLCMLAAMIELTHLASLIHDDIVDESDFRRGKASIQSKHHKDAAVYAGDFLITRVNYTLAQEHLNESSMTLSKTIERMCMGEIGQAKCRYKTDIGVSDYLSNIRGKTAELFKAACLIGSREAGADADTINILKSVGENLGIMFQLRDDLLDFTSEREEIGKASHVDFKEGIYTMPVLHALANDKEHKLLAAMRKNAETGLSDTEIRETEELVVSLSGVEKTKLEITNCRMKIEDLLKGLPGGASKDLLSELTAKLELSM